MWFSCLSSYATEQEDDIVNINGTDFYLSEYIWNQENIYRGIQEYCNFRSFSTANYKGFIGHWSILGDDLYLDYLTGFLNNDMKKSIVYAKDIPTLQPYLEGSMVKATWINGEVYIEGFGRQKIEKGKFTTTDFLQIIYGYHPKDVPIWDSLKEEIYQRFPYMVGSYCCEVSFSASIKDDEQMIKAHTKVIQDNLRPDQRYRWDARMQITEMIRKKIACYPIYPYMMGRKFLLHLDFPQLDVPAPIWGEAVFSIRLPQYRTILPELKQHIQDFHERNQSQNSGKYLIGKTMNLSDDESFYFCCEYISENELKNYLGDDENDAKNFGYIKLKDSTKVIIKRSETDSLFSIIDGAPAFEIHSVYKTRIDDELEWEMKMFEEALHRKEKISQHLFIYRKDEQLYIESYRSFDEILTHWRD